MTADIAEKTARYEQLLAEALEEATVVPPSDTPMAEAATEFWRRVAATGPD
jgi:hypothetical protein